MCHYYSGEVYMSMDTVVARTLFRAPESMHARRTTTVSAGATPRSFFVAARLTAAIKQKQDKHARALTLRTNSMNKTNGENGTKKLQLRENYIWSIEGYL